MRVVTIRYRGDQKRSANILWYDDHTRWAKEQVDKRLTPRSPTLLHVISILGMIFTIAQCSLVGQTDQGRGDGPRVRVAVSGGLSVPTGEARYTSARVGGVWDGVVRYDLGSNWRIGFGGSWGSFSAGVPEFIVFAPFDHDPWLEHSMVFGEVQYVLIPAARVQPFVGGRLGRLSELAEYAGATIRRAGPAGSVAGGVVMRVMPAFGFELSGNMTVGLLGPGRFENVPGMAPSSHAVYLSVRLGVEIAIRR